MAVAGYSNCHMKAEPYSFDVLGTEVYGAVMRFLDATFPNDVPELQAGGEVYPLLLTIGARLVVLYRALIMFKVIIMAVDEVDLVVMAVYLDVVVAADVVIMAVRYRDVSR